WRESLGRLCSSAGGLEHSITLKDSDTTRVIQGVLSVGAARFDVVCKQFRRQGWGRRIMAPLGGSRAERHRRCAVHMLQAGLSTAVPLAQVRVPGPSFCEWLISERILDAVDLDQLVSSELSRLDPRTRRRAKQTIGEAIAGFLATMQAQRLGHRDLKASNVLITNWNAEGVPPRIWVVDLDGLRKQPFRPNETRQLVRLAASLVGCRDLSATDYARCLRRYLSITEGDAASWRPTFAAVSRRARAYVLAAAQRKRGKLDGYTGSVCR
ncbi:MAG: lipopolysaccharide kinase InaA family protein, partial [Phycisphaerae bacterium]